MMTSQRFRTRNCSYAIMLFDLRLESSTLKASRGGHPEGDAHTCEGIATRRVSDRSAGKRI